MRWDNTEEKALSGTTEQAYTEVLELKDRDNNVLKRFSKAADGTLTEVTRVTTPAVARVVTGTIDTALAGTPAALRFGDLRITTVATGEGIPDDDDGTVLIPYLIANVGSIPADNVVDNEDGSFTITCHPGANNIVFSSADAQLTFEDDVEGTDQTSELVDLVDARYQLPATLPEVPSDVDAQDLATALIELGLITQAEA